MSGYVLEGLLQTEMHAPTGVLERIAAGEHVPPDQHYLRTGIRLSTVARRPII